MKNELMNARAYESPEMTLQSVSTERGFATSGPEGTSAKIADYDYGYYDNWD